MKSQKTPLPKNRGQVMTHPQAKEIVIRAASLWANGAANCQEIKEAIKILTEKPEPKMEQGALV